MSSKAVLIAEDEPPLRQLSRDILTDHGYATVEVADGVEAIAQLKTVEVGAVLLDLKMPNVDGWGVLEFVRTMESPPPVILVTGLSEVIPPGHLNQYVAGIVTKPFAITQLLKTLELAFSRSSRVPPSGSRKAARRTFVVETTLLSETGQPMAIGQLQEISDGGFRVELALRLEPNDPVRLSFHVPGRPQPVELRGRVRWYAGGALGAELAEVSDVDAALLAELVAG